MSFTPKYEILKQIEDGIVNAENAILTHDQKVQNIYNDRKNEFMAMFGNAVIPDWAVAARLSIEQYSAMIRYLLAMSFISARYFVHFRFSEARKVSAIPMIQISSLNIRENVVVSVYLDAERSWRHDLMAAGIGHSRKFRLLLVLVLVAGIVLVAYKALL